MLSGSFEHSSSSNSTRSLSYADESIKDETRVCGCRFFLVLIFLHS